MNTSYFQTNDFGVVIRWGTGDPTHDDDIVSTPANHDILMDLDNRHKKFIHDPITGILTVYNETLEDIKDKAKEEVLTNFGRALARNEPRGLLLEMVRTLEKLCQETEGVALSDDESDFIGIGNDCEIKKKELFDVIAAASDKSEVDAIDKTL